MRCHQTFSDYVTVLASVTNDVAVRVLDLIVYYFVTRMDMHVSIKVRRKVLLVNQLHDEQFNYFRVGVLTIKHIIYQNKYRLNGVLNYFIRYRMPENI